MKYLLILSLLLTGCTEAHQKPERPAYPGKQRSFESCHELYDLGYKIDVLKCEYAHAHPKFKPGRKVRVLKYDPSCVSRVIGISCVRWNIKTQEEYYIVRTKCGPESFEDDLNASEIKQ